MKAFLIDTVNKTVTEVESTGDYREIQRAVGGCFDSVRMANGDTVFVDDEGLLNGAAHRLGMFELAGYPQPLAGHGYVTGIDREGDSVSPRTTLAEMQAQVTFMSAREAHEKYFK